MYMYMYIYIYEYIVYIYIYTVCIKIYCIYIYMYCIYKNILYIYIYMCCIYKHILYIYIYCIYIYINTGNQWLWLRLMSSTTTPLKHFAERCGFDWATRTWVICAEAPAHPKRISAEKRMELGAVGPEKKREMSLPISLPNIQTISNSQTLRDYISDGRPYNIFKSVLPWMDLRRVLRTRSTRIRQRGVLPPPILILLSSSPLILTALGGLNHTCVQDPWFPWIMIPIFWVVSLFPMDCDSQSILLDNLW